MSHITEIKIGITSSDVQSGILSRAVAKAISGSTIVNEKAILNQGYGSAWQKQEVDAYISEPDQPAKQIGFKINPETGQYQLVGDFAGRTFEKDFSKYFLEEKVLTNASANNMQLINSYVNPENAAEQVYEFEV
jgi:hypothetical protein